MGARQKLNCGYFSGSLLAAVLVGAFSSSWLIFFVALALLLTYNLYLGDIRPRGRSPRAGRPQGAPK